MADNKNLEVLAQIYKHVLMAFIQASTSIERYLHETGWERVFVEDPDGERKPRYRKGDVVMSQKEAFIRESESSGIWAKQEDSLKAIWPMNLTVLTTPEFSLSERVGQRLLSTLAEASNDPPKSSRNLARRILVAVNATAADASLQRDHPSFDIQLDNSKAFAERLVFTLGLNELLLFDTAEFRRTILKEVARWLKKAPGARAELPYGTLVLEDGTLFLRGEFARKAG